MRYTSIAPAKPTLDTLENPSHMQLGIVTYSDYRLSGDAASSVTNYISANFEGINARIQFGNSPNMYQHQIYKFAESLHHRIDDALKRDPYRVACTFTALAHVFTLVEELSPTMIPSLVDLAVLVANHSVTDTSTLDDVDTDDGATDYWTTYQMKVRAPGVSAVDFAEIVQRFMEGFYAARAIQITAPRVNGTWGQHQVSKKWLQVHGISTCCTFIRVSDGEDGEVKEMLTAAIGNIVHTKCKDVESPEHHELYLNNFELDELCGVVEEFSAGQFVGDSIDSIVPDNYSLGSLDADTNAIDMFEFELSFSITNHDGYNVITTTKVDELSSSLV